MMSTRCHSSWEASLSLSAMVPSSTWATVRTSTRYSYSRSMGASTRGTMVAVAALAAGSSAGSSGSSSGSAGTMIGSGSSSIRRRIGAILVSLPHRRFVATDMSFSIDRYKEESRKLDISGVRWEDVRKYPLSKGDLFCLHYMMDIENHVSLYLSHLLVTRACMDPILTAFLACWNYEELWHGENIGRLLNLYGIEFDTQERIANVRANLGFQNSLSLMSTMAGSWLLKDFSAVYLTIGAINELSTLTGYRALIRKSGHPVLKALLSRIIQDERSDHEFYLN